MSKSFYKKLRKEIMTHECMLPPEESPIIRFINSGHFVYFRRWLRRIMLVSEQNPRSRFAFLSKAAYRRECERHLQHHYWMIHPFSELKLCWEIFMVYVTGVHLFSTPALVFSSYDQLMIHICFKFFADILFFLDILISFNCGYQNQQTNEVILDRKLSVRHYLKTWFLLDFICTINIDFVLIQYTSAFFYLKLLSMGRVLRFATFIRYLQYYGEASRFRSYKFSLFKVILLTVLLLLWFTSIFYLITTLYREQWLGRAHRLVRITSCLYRTTYLLFLIGYGEGGSTHNIVLTFEMVCWTVGICMRFYIIVEIVQILSKYSASSNKYHHRIQRLRDFMRHKGLTVTTSNRILQYFDFRFQKSFYSEEEILATLSPQLRQEIMLQTCKRLVENVNIFKDLPTAILIKLVGCLKCVIFLPNDVIVQAGSIGDEMYFIHNGTVAVYTSGGVEICHLTDGTNFGEVVMVMKEEPRIATVIAVDSCELYSLSRIDFEKAIESYPDLYNRICKIAHDRFAQAALNNF